MHSPAPVAESEVHLPTLHHLFSLTWHSDSAKLGNFRGAGVLRRSWSINQIHGTQSSVIWYLSRSNDKVFTNMWLYETWNSIVQRKQKANIKSDITFVPSVSRVWIKNVMSDVWHSAKPINNRGVAGYLGLAGLCWGWPGGEAAGRWLVTGRMWCWLVPLEAAPTLPQPPRPDTASTFPTWHTPTHTTHNTLHTLHIIHYTPTHNTLNTDT